MLLSPTSFAAGSLFVCGVGMRLFCYEMVAACYMLGCVWVLFFGLGWYYVCSVKVVLHFDWVCLCRRGVCFCVGVQVGFWCRCWCVL